jgi:hypothetical protein
VSDSGCDRTRSWTYYLGHHSRLHTSINLSCKRSWLRSQSLTPAVAVVVVAVFVAAAGNVSTMEASHLKMVVETTPETSCISNTPQTIDNIRHNVPFIRTSKSFNRHPVRLTVCPEVHFSLLRLRARAGIWHWSRPRPHSSKSLHRSYHHASLRDCVAESPRSYNLGVF